MDAADERAVVVDDGENAAWLLSSDVGL